MPRKCDGVYDSSLSYRLGGDCTAFLKSSGTKRQEVSSCVIWQKWLFVLTPYVHNSSLQWREMDEFLLEVASGEGAQRVALRLDFNPEGDIIRSYAPAQP